MADYDSESGANERTDGFHPANVCRGTFVFGCGKDRNHGELKVETHIIPELHSNVRANTNRNKYGGYEGSNSKLSPSRVSEQALINSVGWVQPIWVSEQVLIDSDGWVRASRAIMSMPPKVPLSKVTHDVNAAAAYVRGLARPQSSGLFTADQWSSATSAPYQAGRTIDSKQAAKKYGGQFI